MKRYLTAMAFPYADFRLRKVNWRASAPRLARWVDTIGARASLQATQPQ